MCRQVRWNEDVYRIMIAHSAYWLVHAFELACRPLDKLLRSRVAPAKAKSWSTFKGKWMDVRWGQRNLTNKHAYLGRNVHLNLNVVGINHSFPLSTSANTFCCFSLFSFHRTTKFASKCFGVWYLDYFGSSSFQTKLPVLLRHGII